MNWVRSGDQQSSAAKRAQEFIEGFLRSGLPISITRHGESPTQTLGEYHVNASNLRARPMSGRAAPAADNHWPGSLRDEQQPNERPSETNSYPALGEAALAVLVEQASR